MKSTGITRKIDDLGRIVIPKEIRKNLNIRDNENLEIFIDNEYIVLKKYSQIEKFALLAKQIVDIVQDVYEVEVIITDREKTLVTSNNKEYSLDNKLINLIDNRESYYGIIKNEFLDSTYNIVPIIVGSDSVGLVIVDSKDNPNEKIAKLVATILAKRINIY